MIVNILTVQGNSQYGGKSANAKFLQVDSKQKLYPKEISLSIHNLTSEYKINSIKKREGK